MAAGEPATPASDVFSFALLCLELLYGRPLESVVGDATLSGSASSASALVGPVAGVMVPLPRSTPLPVAALLALCSAADPSQRPSASHAVMVLSKELLRC